MATSASYGCLFKNLFGLEYKGFFFARLNHLYWKNTSKPFSKNISRNNDENIGTTELECCIPTIICNNSHYHDNKQTLLLVTVNTMEIWYWIIRRASAIANLVWLYEIFFHYLIEQFIWCASPDVGIRKLCGSYDICIDRGVRYWVRLAIHHHCQLGVTLFLQGTLYALLPIDTQGMYL